MRCQCVVCIFFTMIVLLLFNRYSMCLSLLCFFIYRFSLSYPFLKFQSTRLHSQHTEQFAYQQSLLLQTHQRVELLVDQVQRLRDSQETEKLTLELRTGNDGVEKMTSLVNNLHQQMDQV